MVIQSKKKALILGGLGGKPSAERAHYLYKLGYTTLYPTIDYEKEWDKDKCKSLFGKFLEAYEDVDVIIGISLGGYLAFELAGALSKNVILINPSLDRDKTALEIKHFDIDTKRNFKNIEVFFGENDELIDIDITMDFLDKNIIKYNPNTIDGMEHNVTIKYFIEILDKSQLLK